MHIQQERKPRPVVREKDSIESLLLVTQLQGGAGEGLYRKFAPGNPGTRLIALEMSDESVEVLVAQPCPTLHNSVTAAARLLCPGDPPGRNTGVGCQALIQGIFPTRSSNLCLLSLLRWQTGSLLLSYLGSPRVHPCSCSLPLWFITGCWM